MPEVAFIQFYCYGHGLNIPQYANYLHSLFPISMVVYPNRIWEKVKKEGFD